MRTLDRFTVIAVQVIALSVAVTQAGEWPPAAGATFNLLATGVLVWPAWPGQLSMRSALALLIALSSGLTAAALLPADAEGRAAVLAVGMAQALALQRLNAANRWILPAALLPILLMSAWQGAWYWAVGILGMGAVFASVTTAPPGGQAGHAVVPLSASAPVPEPAEDSRSVVVSEPDTARARDQAEQALAAARHAVAEKTRFLAAAAHDLRQPVHAIGLFVGALKEEIRDGRGRYLVERLERSMAGLDELFNRLLDISRLDAGTIEPRLSAVPIVPLLQTLETRFTQLAERHQLQFRVYMPKPCTVRSDPALLVEILMNLLSNAFRYTERGGVLLGTRHRGDRLLIQVWDTGIGISPDQTDAIFGEFVQLGNRSRDRRQGLGLGLAIVRRLADSLASPITVRSRPKHGSVFEISLPLSREEGTSAHDVLPGQDWSALHGLLVLAVDDEIDILTGMEALLASWGCFVILARSVIEVERSIEQSERFPDLLITDHRLGGQTTSAAVIAALKERVPVPVPVIVVSGDPSASLPPDTPESGAALLPKPVNPERLRQLILELTRPA